MKLSELNYQPGDLFYTTEESFTSTWVQDYNVHYGVCRFVRLSSRLNSRKKLDSSDSPRDSDFVWLEPPNGGPKFPARIYKIKRL